ncbi:MAG: hypothetical protein LH478_05100 [Chitinophagaceae bacterium]|nr:hypothetical protein [Chitinophagaceae bacterium]
MKTLIIEMDSTSKAKELSSLLSSLDFVRKVSSVSRTKAFIAALQDDENLKASIVKRKNPAIAKYLK